jgi:HTH-type transcriptional regulator, sugar sensing transcriptional regulator
MISQLKAAGLSDNEAKVYLAMLELGPAPVQEIAAKAGVNRPTAYVQIEALKKKHLASTQTRGKKTFFIAESPENLEGLLNKEGTELEARRAEVLRVMPELAAAFVMTDEKPVVRYFEGKEGLAKIRQEVLRCKEKMVRSIARVEDVLITSPDALTARPSERVKHKISSKLIYTSDKGSVLPSDKKMLRESKFISHKKLPITFDFTVFDDKVIFQILHGKVGGIIVQNKDIATSFKNLFDFVWDSIKE